MNALVLLSLVLIGAADWSKLIIFLIFAAISIAAHLIKLANKAKQARPPEMNPQPNRPRQPNPELSNEVEEFLRNVQQRQGEGQGQRKVPRRPAPQRGSAARNQPVMAEVVEAQVVPATFGRPNIFGSGASLSGDAVAVEAESLGRQAQSLGAQINRTDERVAEQLHAKFDHQLGQFGTDQAASDDATLAVSQAEDTDLAADLRQMLADPHDIRRVIVASEILSPPVDRW